MAGIALELEDHPIEHQRREVIGRTIEARVIDITAQASELEFRFEAEALGGPQGVVEIVIDIGCGDRRLPRHTLRIENGRGCILLILIDVDLAAGERVAEGQWLIFVQPEAGSQRTAEAARGIAAGVGIIGAGGKEIEVRRKRHVEEIWLGEAEIDLLAL